MRTLSTGLATRCLVLFGLGVPMALRAQTFPTDDPVIKRLWEEGMTDRSRVMQLSQILLDSIGPRLSGSPGHLAAVNWLQSVYQGYGIPVRKEQYGTWRGWRRGYTHLDLIVPRVRTLNATLLAWSPGTSAPVEGEVVVPPHAADSATFDAWLLTVRGKFVLWSFAEPTCRPDDNWERLARPASLERMRQERNRARADWQARLRRIGGNPAERLEAAGAVALLTGQWSNGWGANKIFASLTDRIPSLHLSCEDYGLVSRLAANNQGPRLRLDARAEEAPAEVPVFNVVAELKGTERPDEYVLLSAHLDSWDGASGATDNGTGTITMLEAMRLLKLAYPQPKRTILVGHWGGEEQGLIGSRAFAEDHREVAEGLQAMFNQDNGTWRIEYIRMMGLTGAGASFGRWFGKIPLEMTRAIELDIPGEPERGGSDHMSLLCEGKPAFRLQSHYPDYRQYTWHTDLDTWDKIVFDDLRNNATLAAMLAYLAADDPTTVPRDRRVLPEGQRWPDCGRARRRFR